MENKYNDLHLSNEKKIYPKLEILFFYRFFFNLCKKNY